MALTPSPRDVRGFNYSGSWGTSGLDLWLHHDRDLMRIEIARGKKYFPGWNVARWWLSHEAFQRSPEKFLADFEDGLSVFDGHGITVMPVLFNRWRDPLCDFGGVPLDHIVPGFSGLTASDEYAVEAPPNPDPKAWGIVPVFRRYLESLVGGHRSDPRIYAWDLCNEPMLAAYVDDGDSPVRAAELRWLQWCRDVAKAIGAEQPITVGNAGVRSLRLTAGMSDLLSFHPYYVPGTFHESPADYERDLDEATSIARESGKELLASETVWGSESDEERVRILRATLERLTAHDIGFIVHALHHSLVADLHSDAYGPVGPPGRLEFIEADGSLRPGHEAFNEFVPSS